MKIGALTRVLGDRSLEGALDRVVELGLEAIELPAGNFVGAEHADPRLLLRDPDALRLLKKAVKDRGLIISALSCHGNPLHPQEKVAASHIEGQHLTFRLAQELEVERVNLLSGCPGDSEGARFPNWVVFGDETESRKVLDWQWREKVVPFWSAEIGFAEKHNVSKVCFEMHGGFSVYNPRTLLRLRDAVGKVVGANFDPSHLFWQGIEPTTALKELAGAVYHFHAKDTQIFRRVVELNGNLPDLLVDPYLERPWMYRTVGYGHGAKKWKDIISTLRMIGYDYVVSIEHEDATMSRDEGLRKAVDLLRRIVISEDAPPVWW